jgi:DNA-binding PadR family transcriptional regulator
VPPGKRSNPLALAVLVCLAERPMHPYEVAQTLRTRRKDDSVRLNYGSLYAVVETLARRGLIEPSETERSGRLPERTIYRITDAGLTEMHDWLAGLIAVPAREYPAFEAALSFLPALDPDEAASLLRERVDRLEAELAGAGAVREMVEKARLPRLLWVEAEFAMTLRAAELGYARRLLADIEAGTLDGIGWWRRIHDHPGGPVPLPPPWEPGGPGGGEPGDESHDDKELS